MANLEQKVGLGPQNASRPILVRFSAALLVGVLLSGCASAPNANDPEAVAEYKELNDPIEPVNRVFFEFNRGLDTMLLRPAAIFYKAMVPPPLQDLVHNFLNNLKTPVILLNDVLQGEGQRAGDTFARFAINSTVGVLGLGDPATGMGFARHSEDFGQTLSVWGSGEGLYLVLPIFGPSNPRDAVGKVVDTLTDPVWHYAQNTDREYITNGRFVTEAVNFRARNLNEIDDLQRTSIDYYAAVRDLYRQIRNDEIRNGTAPTNSGLPAMSMNLDSHSPYAMDAMKDPDATDPNLATRN